jgi:Spy/CpxP family protein refolding chaperone
MLANRRARVRQSATSEKIREEEIMPTKLRWSTVTLLVVLTSGVLLMGQNPAPQTPQQGHETRGAAAHSTDAKLQMLTEKLNLTDEQRTKLKPILQDQSQQQQAVQDNTSLSPEQKTAKIKAIHASFRDQISAVLTPEQQAKLQEMKHEGAEKHQQ